ncbi:hypothetical protein ACCI51_18105 [Microbulbifer echini]|uniref:Uncharacterized protein n=1 Tax=Microbulbifer echini TaxID=1529067 RepID=A0ABV4NT46_9GAMM
MKKLILGLLLVVYYGKVASMNIFEMMRAGEIHPLWFGVFVQSMSLGALCFLLAKSKYRNTIIAFIAGFIPIFNYLAVLYYIGVPKQEKSCK